MKTFYLCSDSNLKIIEEITKLLEMICVWKIKTEIIIKNIIVSSLFLVLMLSMFLIFILVDSIFTAFSIMELSVSIISNTSK